MRGRDRERREGGSIGREINLGGERSFSERDAEIDAAETDRLRMQYGRREGGSCGWSWRLEGWAEEGKKDGRVSLALFSSFSRESRMKRRLTTLNISLYPSKLNP